jgi:hypothetical protein
VILPYMQSMSLVSLQIRIVEVQFLVHADFLFSSSPASWAVTVENPQNWRVVEVILHPLTQSIYCRFHSACG